jgi:hypothetical protein
MNREELPAIVTVGGCEFQHMIGRLWAELESGAVVHIVNKRNGRHRGWLVPERPAGYETVRVSVNTLAKSVGRILDDMRDGAAFEVYDHVRGVARGYLVWAPPDCLAALGWGVSIPYFRRGRTGRLLQRDIYPLAVESEPPSRRREALSGV